MLKTLTPAQVLRATGHDRRLLLVGARKPEPVEDGMVSWPVLFIYPASMQTDSVEAFHELHTFADHLDVMFGPEARSNH